MADDCSLLALPVQMMEVVCGLIPILKQDHSSSESFCGCLLLTTLLQGGCCVTLLLEDLLICRINQVGCPGNTGALFQSPELSCTPSMKCGIKMPWATSWM